MLGGACNTAGWFLFTNRTLPHTRRTYGNGLFDHSNFRLVHSGFCQCFHILAICGYEPPAYHPRPPLARFCPTVLSRVRRVCSADFSVLCQSRRLRSASSNAVSGGAFQGVTPSFHSSEYQLERLLPFRHFYLFAGFLPRRVYMRQRVASHLDRSDAFTPFAPSHTVQATFIAHGVPWDKSLLLIQLLQSLVNCYKVNCFQSCFSSPFVELCNLGRCPTIE